MEVGSSSRGGGKRGGELGEGTTHTLTCQPLYCEVLAPTSVKISIEGTYLESR